jgi:nucleoside-triphosphatase THEP1
MSSISSVKKAYLLTGEPGCGKTTIIKEVLSGGDKSAGGFYTEEIRIKGIRQGFRIVTLDGKQAVLSHVNIEGRYRVGKYGVDIDSMETVACPAVEKAIRNCDIVVVDEIGKMELFSTSFREVLYNALDSNRKVLGTIMVASHPWVDDIKQREDVEVIQVTKSNRNGVLDRISRWLES